MYADRRQGFDVSVLQVRPLIRSDWLRLLLNGLLFNVSWFVVVLSQSALVAGLQLFLHLCIHFVLFGRGLAELRLVALVTVSGVMLDQALFAFGVFKLSGSTGAPLWLSCLWPLFATTLCHAFSALQGRWLIAALIGGIGGTASYIAGVGLSEISFGSSLLSPIVIAALWALLFPLLLWLAQALVPNSGNGANAPSVPNTPNYGAR
jgi:Protein of unknown function (DUF2878)